MNYRVVYKDELKHWGVKGMHWGERRWQYTDGSLTPAGRIHYGYGPPRERAKEVISGRRPSAGTVTNTKNRVKGKSEWDHSTNDSTFADSIKRAFGISMTTATMFAGSAYLRTGNPTIALAGLGIGAAAGLISTGYIAVNKAVQEKKFSKAENKLKESGTVDEKTGFYKKADREYTEKEDIAAVNPGYKKYTNDTKNNCMLCTLTYDLRKRGYNVSANMASEGFMSSDIKRWYKDAKVKTTAISDDDWASPTSNKARKSIDEMLDFVKETMEKEPPGSHGYLGVQYFVPLKQNFITVGVAARGGHAMAYEVREGGKIDIVDAQSNKVYKDVFNTNSCKLLKQSTDVSFVRLDNLDINTDTIKEVAHS